MGGLSFLWNLNIMYQLLLKEEPLSLNHADKERKDEYRKRLHALINARYDLEGKKVPLDRSHRCYLLVAYFFKGKKERDIDNILKYTQDAFSKKIYKDDSQIFFCLSEAISLDTGDYTLLDMDKFEPDIAADIYEFASSGYDREHLSVTYIECGDMNSNFYKSALEIVWK